MALGQLKTKESVINFLKKWLIMCKYIPTFTHIFDIILLSEREKETLSIALWKQKQQRLDHTLV